jgi:hypothetical protein
MWVLTNTFYSPPFGLSVVLALYISFLLLHMHCPYARDDILHLMRTSCVASKECL